ncbi:type II toxin-antitoxin system VapC family toxin [Leadbettera azotonutricia]|uniref:PilT protein domain protein n=1 Tax=Leadbettera azotonutricia (strain ATCC BAA-888 / DSM 13862 / ZAS-9) TaxID=545695 RepID=F5YCN9_LEAAZ|nr:type II toxin-antitoxin system VapC family toxin [Leadbettera azotonutricia]AEF80247.1 PilT protein domain protein [Leadbettera azotonutricia ZAS-9]
MIFLDTDTISYYFAGNNKIKEKIIETMDTGEQICLTAINVYEVLKGLKWRNNKNKEEQFNEFLQNIRVYTLDDGSISNAADIYADLRRNGITIGDADILIAGIVINNNGTLITNNTQHYQGIKKLRLKNWI